MQLSQHCGPGSSAGFSLSSLPYKVKHQKGCFTKAAYFVPKHKNLDQMHVIET